MKHAAWEPGEVRERMINDFDEAMLELDYLEDKICTVFGVLETLNG